MEYKIIFVGDSNVTDVHHIIVEYDGFSYSVIFGKYLNGGFCSIPNMKVGCELSFFDDVFWNTESLYSVLKSKKAAKAIAMAIAESGQAKICTESCTKY